jgi:predicted TIM-barrel fold metal-dependent hydrolase
MLPRMAARMAAHNWHIQFQMDGRELHTRESLLGALPCALIVEHIGKFFEPVGVDHLGFQALLRLIDGGRCWVKLSGAYMMSKSGPPLYEDIGVWAKALVAHAPERMLWGTGRIRCRPRRQCRTTRDYSTCRATGRRIMLRGGAYWSTTPQCSMDSER